MYRWKPSKSAKRDFAQKMQEIDDFCADKGISQSHSGDSYYFEIRGQKYRVSNHTVEASDRGAYDWTGEQVREKYHDGRDDDTIYITAGKTRIIEIYEALEAGRDLDGRGRYRGEGVKNDTAKNA